MPILPVKRFTQNGRGCAAACISSILNYYNSKADMSLISKKFKTDVGMYTPEIACMLNIVGFDRVAVHTCDLNVVDFAWASLGEKALSDKLFFSSKKTDNKHISFLMSAYSEFLSLSNYSNHLYITPEFKKAIVTEIDNERPCMVSFNWNIMFMHPKFGIDGFADPILGSFEDHLVVINGYDDDGVYIVDPHEELYKGKLERFSSGRYHIFWDKLLTAMGPGDVISAGNYRSESIYV